MNANTFKFLPKVAWKEHGNNTHQELILVLSLKEFCHPTAAVKFLSAVWIEEMHHSKFLILCKTVTSDPFTLPPEAHLSGSMLVLMANVYFFSLSLLHLNELPPQSRLSPNQHLIPTILQHHQLRDKFVHKNISPEDSLHSLRHLTLHVVIRIISIVFGSPFQILSKYFIERLGENFAECKEELYK